MSLGNATRSEFTKQFTTVGWWVIGVILVAYLLMFAVGMGAAVGASASGSIPGGQPIPLPADQVAPWIYSLAASSGYVLPLLFGTLMVTSEFRHKLIVPTLLANPRRGVVLSSKLIVGVIMGAIYGVVAIASTIGGGAGMLAVFGQETALGSTGTWAMAGRVVLALILWTLVGIGVGSVIRNQVAAIVVVLAFTQFVEPVIRMAGMFVDQLREPLQYLPGAASDALVGQSLLAIAGTGDAASNTPAWWVGALVLAGYAVLLTVIGTFTTWRRDID
jgi:ABC-2 type transport system permease protein